MTTRNQFYARVEKKLRNFTEVQCFGFLCYDILNDWIESLKKVEPEWNWARWEGDTDEIDGVSEIDRVMNRPVFRLLRDRENNNLSHKDFDAALAKIPPFQEEK